jgi:protocatechuate 3,4-dioxygenase beta subunit
MKLGAIAGVLVLVAAGLFLLLRPEGERGPLVPTAGGQPAEMGSPARGPATEREQAAPVAVRPYDAAEEVSAAPPLAGTGSRGHELTGIVRDPDGQPLAGAQVSLFADLSLLREVAQQGDLAARVVTGRSGRFAFPDLPGDENFLLVVTHAQYAQVRRHPIAPRDPATLHQDIRMQPGGIVRGHVRTTDGSPVPGALVSVHDLATQTLDPDPPGERSAAAGPDGSYAVPGLAPGIKKVLARSPGLATDGRIGVQVAEGVPSDVDFELDAGATIEGIVVEKRTGAPVAGAQVLGRPQGLLAEEGVSVPPDDVPLSASEDGIRGSDPILTRLAARSAAQRAAVAEKFFLQEPATTDERGVFRLQGLLPARYLIQVRAAGYLQASAILADSGSSGHRIELLRNPAVRGRVIDDETGASVTRFSVAQTPSEAAVWLAPMSRQRFESTDGTFRYVDAMPGRYWFLAEAPGYARSRSLEAVQIVAEQEAEGVLIRMQRGSTLRGRVLDPRGEALPGAMVEVTAGTTPGIPDTPISMFALQKLRGSLDAVATTAGDGSFEIPHLPASTVRLRVSHPDHLERRTEDLVLDGRGVLELPGIQLLAGGGLRGTVHRTDGGPDADAIVMLQPRDGTNIGARTASTDAEGRYEFRGLRPGSYQLLFLKREGRMDPFSALLGAQAANAVLVTIVENEMAERDL